MQDRLAFSSILANPEKDATEKYKEYDRINHDIQNCEASSHHESSRATVAEIIASPSCKEHARIDSMLGENHNVHSCVSESAFSPSVSVYSDSQPAAIAPNVPVAEEKDNCYTFIQQLDSECSTTVAGVS